MARFLGVSSFMGPLYKFQCDGFGNEILRVRLVEQTADSLLPFGSIVQRQLVHVHSDEPIDALRIHAPCKMKRIGQGFFRMSSATRFISVLPRSRLMTFPPSGNGNPVCSSHHSPRSRTLCRPISRY